MYSLSVSEGQEFKSVILHGYDWKFPIRFQSRYQLGQQSPKGSNGSKGTTSEMAHPHIAGRAPQFTSGYWQKAQFFGIWASPQGCVLTTWHLAPPEWVIHKRVNRRKPQCSLWPSFRGDTPSYSRFIRNKSLILDGQEIGIYLLKGGGHIKELMDIFKTTTQKNLS